MEEKGKDRTYEVVQHSQSRDDVAGILYQLIEVVELLSPLKLFHQMLLQMLQLVTDPHDYHSQE